MTPRTRRESSEFAFGLLGIALVTLWRIVMLRFDRADLFVDDAQYWFWGQELAWGYYSKPPLIGWILRASTAIGGDGMVWIRLPLPLIHAGTAVIMALIGRRLFDARVGALAGFAYVSLPGVALGSLLVSTDTPLLLCFALAMLAQVHLMERRSPGWALVLGAAVGVGLLAKYAMIYYPLSAVLAAVVVPRSRIGWRAAGIAAALALVIVAPNLWWNAANGFSTLYHTADNADLAGEGFHFEEFLEFFAAQFAVSGPVFFAAFLLGLPRGRDRGRFAFLAAMALPALVIVSIEALRAEANANWAAVGHLGALLIAMAVLRDRRRWLAVGFAFNLAVTAALPVMTVFADTLRLGSGDLLLSRYVGRADVSRKAEAIARAEGLDTLVSGDRGLLADFFYTLRDSGLSLYAEPTKGFPPHHYAQKHPLPDGPGEVLFLTKDAAGPRCSESRLVESWTPADGFYTHPFYAFRAPRSCWFKGQS